LVDSVWFYGGKREDILTQLQKPKHGKMPSWSNRLDEQTIRQLAIYVHSLGGGEKEEPAAAEAKE
jgi:cytochrome c oxidase cbb3-type subunit 3